MNLPRVSRFRSCVLVALLAVALPSWSAKKMDPRPRVIITADPELDDNNSLIRFLLYSSDVRVEGLVYTSSQFHWSGDGKGTKFMVPGREYTRYGLNLCPCESYRWKKGERFIHDAVDQYEKVYANLKAHNPDYPDPTFLRSKIRYGNIEFEGDMSKDTEGSDLIKSVILDEVPGTLFITAWGGQSSIGRALKSIEEQYSGKAEWTAIRKKIIGKVVLLPSGDQDGVHENYLAKSWPDMDYRQFRNGPNYSYGAQLVANAGNAPLLTPEWMKEHVTSKGPLGSIYRVWGDGKQMVEGDRFDYFGIPGKTNEELKQMGYIVWMPVQPQGAWLGEGDNPTFMNLLANGLNAFDPNFPGGWGGRPFYPDMKAYRDPFSNTDPSAPGLVISESTLKERAGEAAPFPDFFGAAQRDFAARLEWSVNPDTKTTNHPPVIRVNGKKEIQSQPGGTVRLKAAVSDPDNDSVDLRWWQFKRSANEPALDIVQTGTAAASVTLPATSRKGQEFFVVLEATDKAGLSLTRYAVFRIKL
ncbi:MAG: DUF1593 domain-containing protein [Cyclobacteriaceae bacterium]